MSAPLTWKLKLKVGWLGVAGPLGSGKSGPVKLVDSEMSVHFDPDDPVSVKPLPPAVAVFAFSAAERLSKLSPLLILLCHSRNFSGELRPQPGYHFRFSAMAAAMCQRRVEIELWTCRCGRTGAPRGVTFG